MFTILSALGGFAASVLPDAIGQFFRTQREKADRAHELAILDRQLKQQAEGHAQRIEEINVQADIAESEALNERVTVVGVRWVDALNSSVRPVVTYCFFALFASTVIAALVGTSLPDGVWTVEIQALFSAVMGYWFGNRSVKHYRRG